jgi:hypothetical protein
MTKPQQNSEQLIYWMAYFTFNTRIRGVSHVDIRQSTFLPDDASVWADGNRRSYAAGRRSTPSVAEDSMHLMICATVS